MVKINKTIARACVALFAAALIILVANTANAQVYTGWFRSSIADSTTIVCPTGFGCFYYNKQTGSWRLKDNAGWYDPRETGATYTFNNGLSESGGVVGLGGNVSGASFLGAGTADINFGHEFGQHFDEIDFAFDNEFRLWDGNNNKIFGLQPGASQLFLPLSGGSSGRVLMSDGSGNWYPGTVPGIYDFIKRNDTTQVGNFNVGVENLLPVNNATVILIQDSTNVAAGFAGKDLDPSSVVDSVFVGVEGLLTNDGFTGVQKERKVKLYSIHDADYSEIAAKLGAAYMTSNGAGTLQIDNTNGAVYSGTGSPYNKGIQYGTDLTATFVNESLVTKRYADNHVGSKSVSSLLTSPGSGQNGYAVTWDNGNNRYTLSSVAGLTGSGTTNELAYFTGSSALGSLTTSTYPSLTELSYVKGVTSSIQTQFGNKQPLDAGLTALAALDVSGNNGKKIEISGGTFVASAQLTNPCSATGGTLVWNASTGEFDCIVIGTNGQVLTSNGTTAGWQTPTSSSALSAITAATTTATVNHGANNIEWQWNTLAGASAFKLSSTSTAAASNLNALFDVRTSGANANSNQSTYAGIFTNTKTGSGSVNYGLYLDASGGGTNIALNVNAGEVRIASLTSGRNVIVGANGALSSNANWLWASDVATTGSASSGGPLYKFIYNTTGGGGGLRATSGSTDVFQIAVNSLGVYGGSANNVNGANAHIYDMQASAYRWGIGPTGTMFVGPSSSTFGMSVTQAGVATITGSGIVGGNSTAAGFLDFKEDADNGTNRVRISGPASTGDVDLTLPNALPAANDHALVGSTGGVLSFKDITAIAGTKILTKSVSQVNNSGSSETDIHTYTVAANRLNAELETITAKYVGTFSDASVTHQIKTYFAGNVIFDSGALSISGAGDWEMNVTIMRLSSSFVKTSVVLITPTATTTTHQDFSSPGSISFTTTNVLKVTGTVSGGSASDGDITAEMAIVKWDAASN